MKKTLSIFLIFLTAACSKNSVAPNDLVGKWDNTYEIRDKDENGEWQDWTTINTYILLPQLEFTASGEILWNGLPSGACCSFKNYELKGNEIDLTVLVDNEDCAAVNCAPCDTWTINTLSDSTLELDLCGNSMVRYRRAEQQ